MGASVGENEGVSVVSARDVVVVALIVDAVLVALVVSIVVVALTVVTKVAGTVCEMCSEVRVRSTMRIYVKEQNVDGTIRRYDIYTPPLLLIE